MFTMDRCRYVDLTVAFCVSTDAFNRQREARILIC